MSLQQGERLLSDNAAYGSRKIFYDRIWSRLHGTTQKSEEAMNAVDKSEGLEKDNTGHNKRNDSPNDAVFDPTSKRDEKRQRVKEVQTAFV